LPASFASDIGQFDAVIHGIADQVGQRIPDGFDDGFVQLDILAFQVQFDLFA
jgi:hypothetical protein